jgi:hypothetical protein
VNRTKDEKRKEDIRARKSRKRNERTITRGYKRNILIEKTKRKKDVLGKEEE